MSRKSKSETQSTTPVADVVNPPVADKEKPKKDKEKSKKESKSKKTTKEETVAVAAPVVVESKKPKSKSKKSKAEVVSDGAEESKGGDEVDGEHVKKTRVAPTKDSLLSSIDSMISNVDGDIDTLKGDNVKKTVGIKKLKTFRKDLKLLRNTVLRVIKQKTGKRSANFNKNSGFQKPVQISAEMADFIQVDNSELISRVSVTRALCKYIRESNLQNPYNKRNIIPDDRLCKLLRYDVTKEPALTFPLLQRYMKIHFV